MKFKSISRNETSMTSTSLKTRNSLKSNEFRQSLETEFKQFHKQQTERFEQDNCLTVDLHCHDHNSDLPDELFPRILGVPETWLKSEDLLSLLKKNGCDAFTITNHNNARSCWEMIERGHDLLVAAEFTCLFPEYELYIHVLAYGFTQEQEIELNHLRQNIYNFVKYAAQHSIPLILPHPLYFYTRNDKIDLSLFEKLAVMFERFEIINGQRDLWQSMLTLAWLKALTPDKINSYALKHQLNPQDFGVDPNKKKVFTGGSDDHTGIFAGICGSRLYIPNLQSRLQSEKKSDLILEAIRQGNIAPYGQVGESQKLHITLLDYFSQAFVKLKDPGLLRILLHRGPANIKLYCFLTSNLTLELRKNKRVPKLFNLIHNALHGKKVSAFTYWLSSKELKFYYDALNRIADSRNSEPEQFSHTVIKVLNKILKRSTKRLINTLYEAIVRELGSNTEAFSFQKFTTKFEVPSQLSNLLSNEKQSVSPEILKLLNEILSSLLISITIIGTALSSTRSFYSNRRLLNQFSNHVNKHRHPERALYLTDTLKDKNGVSHSLTAKLKEIQKADLAIDFVICHPTAEPENNLQVVRPIASYEVPNYPQQQLHVPDLMEIVNIFHRGGYDRVICSTEGPMMMVAMLLKLKFNVPCFFFMHTDWISFLERTTKITNYGIDNFKIILSHIYQFFDGVFVLNTDHKNWLTSNEIGLDTEKVHLTAHHVNPINYQVQHIEKSSLFTDADENTPILFVACRISEEKGLFELPEIMNKLKIKLPDIKLVIAGTGPAEIRLKALLPDAKFLGWQTQEQLASLYTSLDLFIFPSQFDTFGNVILQAFSHSMPVVSYNCKGPKQLIEHNQSGFLVNNIDEMVETILFYFNCKKTQATVKKGAKERSEFYQAELIMAEFLSNLGLATPKNYACKTPIYQPSTIKKTVA